MVERSYTRPRTVKLDKYEDIALQQHCVKLGTDVSTFIREAVAEKMMSGHISNIAGQNIIEFNSKKDKFTWKLKLDSGEEKIVLEDISPEFMDELFRKISLRMNERAQLLGKKKKGSVAVPRRLVK